MSQYYYLRGPINNGVQCYLTAIHDNYLYFLTRNGSNLILDPRNPGLVGGPQAIINTVNIKNNSTFSLSYSGGGNAGIDQNNYMMIQSGNNPAQFTPVATDLNAASLLVAGPTYTLNVGGAPVQVYAYTPVPNPNPNTNTVYASDILLDDNGVAVLQTFTAQFKFVPLKWYLSNNCSQSLSTPMAVINNEALWTQYSLFGTATNFQTGFTTQSDCNNGVFYDYCILPAGCGEANNCVGACSNSGQTCKFNSNNSTFSCQNTNNVTSNWWFWVIIAVIVVIIIALLIWLIVWSTRSKPAEVATVETVEYTEPSANYVGFVDEDFP